MTLEFSEDPQIDALLKMTYCVVQKIKQETKEISI